MSQRTVVTQTLLIAAALVVPTIARSHSQPAPNAGTELPASWVKVGENDRLTAYYERASAVSNRAGNVVVWVLYDYRIEQGSERSVRRYFSQKGQQELDCAAGRSRTVFFTWHSGRMGSGRVVYTGPTPTLWEPNSPDSIARALATLICIPGSSAPFASQQEQDASIAATLKKSAGDMNAQAPLQLDDDTRMMSVVALQKTLTFNMKLAKYSSTEVDSASVARGARENLNHTVCQSKATRDLIDLGVQYVYLYYGTDGKLIARVVIDRYQC